MSEPIRANHVLYPIIEKIIMFGKIPSHICFYHTFDFIKYENEDMYFKSTQNDDIIVVSVPQKFIDKAIELYKEHEDFMKMVLNKQKGEQ